MDRRKFIAAAALSAAASVIQGPKAFASSNPALEHQGLVSVFSHAESARAVGERYLALHPEEREPEKLADAIYGASPLSRDWKPGGAAVHKHLEEKIKKDFKQGHTVRLDGWILASTEGRLCALVALL